MTTPEYKSECCGADVDLVLTNLVAQPSIFYCSQCRKPCSIAKLPKASKAKEERDAKE